MACFGPELYVQISVGRHSRANADDGFGLDSSFDATSIGDLSHRFRPSTPVPARASGSSVAAEHLALRRSLGHKLVGIDLAKGEIYLRSTSSDCQLARRARSFAQFEIAVKAMVRSTRP